MPAVARIGDNHTCPLPLHVGGAIAGGATRTLWGGKPPARVGDPATCQCGGPDTISQGEATVLVGGQPLARLGDPTEHGGVIVSGCPTILVGRTVQSRGLLRAAKRGSPLCEVCDKAKKKKKKAGKGKSK